MLELIFMQALKTGSISPDALQSPIKRLYIIKIYQTITKIYLAHGSYHQASKYQWSIAEPEGHTVGFKEPKFPNLEGSLLFFLMFNLQVPSS